LPGRHVTDLQMRLFMQFRKSAHRVAAARPVQPGTAYRLERTAPSLQKRAARRRGRPAGKRLGRRGVPMLKAAGDKRRVHDLPDMAMKA